jgi:hypothetical protein
MLRRFALYAIVAVLSAAGAFPFLFPTFRVSSMHIAGGEFWRLPWVAGKEQIVYGNGYQQAEHYGSSKYALDFRHRNEDGSVDDEGRYVTAVQEGTVIHVENRYNPWDCDPSYLAGNYVEITDAGGFVSHYAHLSEVFKNVNDYIEPGWAIGKAGSTGYLVPCGSANAHLHFRINKSGSCDGGNCIPEPLSDQCADWNYWYGIPISCGQMGDGYEFSSDPASQFPGWKTNEHTSNNAGVGDYQFSDFQSVPAADTDIQERYLWEGGYYPSYYFVGKPVDLWGSGPWVYPNDLWGHGGVAQIFYSPSDDYGFGAIMHGDGVDHDPDEATYGSSHAFYIYGQFFLAYIQNRPGTSNPLGYYLGYPKSQRFSPPNCYLGIEWVQLFQDGHIRTMCDDPDTLEAYDNDGGLLYSAGLPLDPPEPTPVPTRKPTKTPTPKPTNTPIPTATPTITPTPTATPNVDTDGDGFLDHLDNCPLVANHDQANADGDGFGDACDVCTNDPNDDADNDGICAGSGYLPPTKTGDKDNCPNNNNPDQLNTDGRRPNGSQIPGEFASNPKQDNMGNACDDDDDNDRFLDTLEPYGCWWPIAPTNPLIADTDGDRVIDGAECRLASNPNNPNSRPRCGGISGDDNDGDCLENYAEQYIFGSDPNNRDTDGDGIDDDIEVKGYGTSPASTDTDGDACPDWLEIMDLDGDRTVDSVDLSLMTERVAGVIPPSDSDPIFDVNKDGYIDVGDEELLANNTCDSKGYDCPCSPEYASSAPVAPVAPAVGGVAELPEGELPSALTARGPSAANTVALAGATAGVVVLAAGGWYARRRRRAGSPSRPR